MSWLLFLNLSPQSLFYPQNSMQECFSLASNVTVFQVPVTKAIALTREDAVKTALLLELDISVSSVDVPFGISTSVKT